MEKILRQISVFLALMYLHPRASHSALITYPSDTEVLLNHSTYFNCSTSILNEQIHWYHFPAGEDQLNYVYYKGQFNANYADRYSIQVNIEAEEYNLNIRLVQPGDAGRYMCQDDGGLGGQSSAELIVLDSAPACVSSMKPDGLVGPNSCGLPIEELHLSCSVLYSGNIPPVLQWKMEGEDTPITKGIDFDNPGRSATINLTMSAEAQMDRGHFTCATTRSHHKQHSCTTNPVKINYAVGELMNLNITKGESVTCSVKASVPCQYRWYTEVIKTTDLMDYSCEANCTMNGLSCIFTAMRIFVIETETSIMAVVGGLCAIFISNIIVALGVRKYYLRGAKDSSNGDDTETKQYQDLATTQRQANPDRTYIELQLQPVYEEVSKRGQ